MSGEGKRNFSIRTFQSSDDVEIILASFFWQEREQWQRYYEEHMRGERVTMLAIQTGKVAGYANLVWQSDYEPFREMGIPEINNMHVLPEYQRQGIATALVHESEKIAASHAHQMIGIGVGQTDDYAAARRLYPKLGYIPDGRGVKATPWGDVEYLTKKLSAKDQ